jgi:phosphatidylglycerophosphatase A
MSIKESSDELNPTVATANTAAVRPVGARSFKDYLALAIATCGVGYLPLAPGTWGSLLAIVTYWLVRWAVSVKSPDTFAAVTPSAFLTGQVLVIAVVTVLGTWSASRSERVLELKDPGKVVVDEVAGQLIALLPLFNTWESPSLWLVLTAFILFRFFDIVKPYPARKLESLHGGLGIMADDLVAGAYAAIMVGVILWFGWLV